MARATRRWRSEAGLSLVETLVGIAVFVLIGVSVYQAYATLLRVFVSARIRFIAGDVANAELELIRNLPFGEVGIVGGVPPGIIASTTIRVREQYSFSVTPTIRNVDDPFDRTATSTPPDTSPADYKIVELAVTCTNCPGSPIYRFTGRVAPHDLESASTNGSLFVQALDASGQGVSGATVQIINESVNPSVEITDSTDTDGFLRVIDVVPSTQSYEVTVSKYLYSTDRTYASSQPNPNPTKLHATVAAQTVTQASFQIDELSEIDVSTVGETCVPISSVQFWLTGAKLIGTNPNVLKYPGTLFSTDVNGSRVVSGLEWDTYTVTTTPQQGGYDLAGTIPLSPFALAPDATQAVKLVMKPGVPNGFLAAIKDTATGLPLSGASVTLSNAGMGFSQTIMTGRGFLAQTDWSGGPGQAAFSNPLMYAEDDGKVETVLVPGEVRLKLDGGAQGEARRREPLWFVRRGFAAASQQYLPSGTLTSSTFDAGSASTFYQLSFAPLSQNPNTGPDSVRLQFASATTSSPTAWNFLGPDGTPDTSYAASNANINLIHNGDRYFRYKLLLQTASTTYTPNVSDVSVTFASVCVAPGSAYFTGLAKNEYLLTVSLAGYNTVQDTVNIASGWQWGEVSLVPSGGGGMD